MNKDNWFVLIVVVVIVGINVLAGWKLITTKGDPCRIEVGDCAYLSMYPETKGAYIVEDCGWSCWNVILRIREGDTFKEIKVNKAELIKCGCK